MLNGAQKNLSANSENAEPLTYNFVFTALSGFQLLSIQRFLGARSRAAEGETGQAKPDWFLLRIDVERRQEFVILLFEMLRDYNVRRLCDSFVGANGCSPERGLGWNLCLLREKRDHRRSRNASRSIGGRNALRSISRRKAGEEHARTQCPLRGERAESRSGLRGSGYKDRVTRPGLRKPGY